MKKSHNISQKEISEYLNGRMDADQEHAFEEAMHQDPFLSEAVDGFSEHPAAVEIEGTEKRLRDGLGLRSYRFGITIGSLVLLSVLGIFIWQQNREKLKVDSIENRSVSTAPLIKEAPKGQPLTEENTANDPEKTFVSSSQTDSSMSFTFIMNEEKEIDEEETFVNVSREAIEKIPEKVERTKNFKSEEEKTPEEESLSMGRLAQPRGRSIYHIEDYKVVDYRDLREQNISQEDLLHGLPPNSENEFDDREALLETRKVEFTYVDFLEQAMHDFANKNFTKASKHFDRILDHYPEDANALFYGGMAAMNGGKPLKAEELFKRSLSNEISTFHQESSFYLAKTYLMLDRTPEARQQLMQIAKSQSFYKKRALEELENF